MTTSKKTGLHRFALFTAGCTLLLLVAGALVTSNDAGLSVPDWPLSYGSLTPPMVGGIRYEHSHRLIASFVGLLTIVLAVWLWLREPRPWVRRLGLVEPEPHGQHKDRKSTRLNSSHLGISYAVFCLKKKKKAKDRASKESIL